MYRKFDDKTLKKLHDTHLELLDEFVKICDKHKFNYSLAYGTLLGAIRHKGFIPWDDDVDLFMPRSDYEEFLKIAQEELGEKYYLDHFGVNKDYYLQFAKLKKNGTLFDEETTHNFNNHKGIFIDIFPVDNVSDNYKIAHTKAALIKIISNTISVKNKFCKVSETRYPFVVRILKIFSKKSLMKIQRKLSVNKNSNSKYIACYYSVYPFKKEMFERSEFLPTTKAEFEGKNYQVVKNYDKFLF